MVWVTCKEAHTVLIEAVNKAIKATSLEGITSVTPKTNKNTKDHYIYPTYMRKYSFTLDIVIIGTPQVDDIKALKVRIIDALNYSINKESREKWQTLFKNPMTDWTSISCQNKTLKLSLVVSDEYISDSITFPKMLLIHHYHSLKARKQLLNNYFASCLTDIILDYVNPTLEDNPDSIYQHVKCGDILSVFRIDSDTHDIKLACDLCKKVSNVASDSSINNSIKRSWYCYQDDDFTILLCDDNCLSKLLNITGAKSIYILNDDGINVNKCDINNCMKIKIKKSLFSFCC